jgi:putative CocE/NonD family hydrolase
MGKTSRDIESHRNPTALSCEGFAVVVQDIRGRCASGGDDEYHPFVDAAADGADTIACAAAQPFSSGDVFMVGSSYHGFVQWAAAAQQHPALCVIAPSQSIGIPWRSLIYRGGVLEFGCFVHVHCGRHSDAPARERSSG